MEEIIVAGTIDMDPDRIDSCVAGITPWQAAARENEPGCLAYVFAPDPVVAGRLSVFERWADADALMAHLSHENYLQMRQIFGEHGLRQVDVLRFRVDAVAPFYDEDRVARPHRWPS